MIVNIYDKDVSVIYVNYNSTALLIDSINSVIKETRSISYEIIVVDNASPNCDCMKVKELFNDKIILLELKKNIGFGGANNMAIPYSHGKYLFFINPDTCLIDNAISCFFNFCEFNINKNIGAVGSILLTKERWPANSYGCFLSPKSILLNLLKIRRSPRIEFIKEPISVDFITGADLFVSHKVFNEVGGFDIDFFMYCEEVDLQYKICKAGYKRIIIPNGRIIHYDGGSFKKKSMRSAIRRMEYDRSQCIYIKKHYNKMSYYAFIIAFSLIRIPAIINPHYTWRENFEYAKMLFSINK